MLEPVRPVKIFVRQRTRSMGACVLPAVTRILTANLLGTIVSAADLRVLALDSRAGSGDSLFQKGEVIGERVFRGREGCGEVRLKRTRLVRGAQPLEVGKEHVPSFRRAVQHQV